MSGVIGGLILAAAILFIGVKIGRIKIEFGDFRKKYEGKSGGPGPGKLMK